MSEYRQKTTTVQAAFYDGTDASVAELIAGEKISHQDALQYGRGDQDLPALYILGKNRNALVLPRNWLVKHPNGVFTAMTEHEFEKRYEAAPTVSWASIYGGVQ